jgi:hypothetical protein
MHAQVASRLRQSLTGVQEPLAHAGVRRAYMTPRARLGRGVAVLDQQQFAAARRFVYVSRA